MSEARHLTPFEAAACPVGILERRGATFEVLDEDGHFLCDLNGIPDIHSHDEAEELSGFVLALGAEIRQVLVGRRTIH